MRNADFCMELKRAECPVKVAEIADKTIRAVYPHYYPSGAAQFFLDLHSEQRIREALAEEDIYFVAVQGEIAGTGSIRGNEISHIPIPEKRIMRRLCLTGENIMRRMVRLSCLYLSRRIILL